LSSFNLPTGLAFDARGNLYVADSGNHRILVFAKPCCKTSLPYTFSLKLFRHLEADRNAFAFIKQMFEQAQP